MHRRKAGKAMLAAAAGALAAFCLPGCSSLAPNEVTVGLPRLQASLDERFPSQLQFLGLLELTVQSPRLSLHVERNRVGVALALRGTERLSNRAFSARLELEHGLRYEVADHSIRVHDVRLVHLGLDGAGSDLGRHAQALASAVANRLLHDKPLHRLRPEEVERLRSLGRRPGAITVKADALSVALVPLPSP